jgi:DNA-binding transcriptional MerR regulator
MIPTNKKSAPIQIPDRHYFRIGDVAELLNVKPHVLRYWESEFPILAPQKSSTGQRVYRRSDVETLVMIKHLLHEERYSIEGARKRIRELRKEGELKDFKKSAVTSASVRPSGRTSDEASDGSHRMDNLELIVDSARALSELARKPLADLFHF